jgi:hypothetical protein
LLIKYVAKFVARHLADGLVLDCAILVLHNGLGTYDDGVLDAEWALDQLIILIIIP